MLGAVKRGFVICFSMLGVTAAGLLVLSSPSALRCKMRLPPSSADRAVQALSPPRYARTATPWPPALTLCWQRNLPNLTL